MNTIPVTNHDFSPTGCRERIERLVAEPPIKIILLGGGMEVAQQVEFDQPVLIHRNELNEILRHLRALEAK